jgi:hypothetical protein
MADRQVSKDLGQDVYDINGVGGVKGMQPDGVLVWRMRRTNPGIDYAKGFQSLSSERRCRLTDIFVETGFGGKRSWGSRGKGDKGPGGRLQQLWRASYSSDFSEQRLHYFQFKMSTKMSNKNGKQWQGCSKSNPR